MRSAARINSFALAGLGDGELHVVGKWLVFPGKFPGNHAEHVVKFMLRFFGRAANRMAAFDGGNIGNEAAIVITPVNELARTSGGKRELVVSMVE